MAVDRDQLVRIRLVVGGAGAEDDPDGGRTTEELPDRRGGLDGLVGVVVAVETGTGLRASRVTGRAQDPQVAAVGVVHAVGDAGGRIASLDDLGLSVAVEVGQRRRGEVAIGLEPGEPVQQCTVGCVEGVLILPE